MKYYVPQKIINILYITLYNSAKSTIASSAWLGHSYTQKQKKGIFGTYVWHTYIWHIKFHCNKAKNCTLIIHFLHTPSIK